MKTDPMCGKTIQWTFNDGPMSNRTFEHSFKEDGSLTFRSIDGKGDGKLTRVKEYGLATVGPDVYLVSYLGPSGYALTVVLDYRSGRLVALASNEKDLTLQHGMFREVEAARRGPSADSEHAQRAR